MADGFEHLFSTTRIGLLNLRNRLMMSLYPTKYVTDGYVNERLIEFFRARAQGGVSLIVLDGCCLDYPAAAKGPADLRMDTPAHADGLKRLLEAVQKPGARAFMQLNYPSALSVDRETSGAVEKKGRWVLPLVDKASSAQLERIIGLFGAGAARAREIGYDGVEIQASWGDLISQFLSPLTNHRDDEYGRTADGRMRFLLDTVKAAKSAAGSDFPVQIKLVVDELVPGGFNLADGEAVAGELEKAGADAILVNVGNKQTKRHSLPPHALPHGVNIDYAAAIKSVVGIPVIAMGKINSPALADRAIAAGAVDMIAMTRALIADPELPNKAKAGRVEEIRGCIYCLDDCADKGVPGLGRACVNNPMAGREGEVKVVPALRSRLVWVIGGGPAGMQAAITARERGHRVRLFEKRAHLGGAFRLAPLAPHKAEVSEILRWLEYKLEQLKIEVVLGREISLGEIETAGPDLVMIATGSSPKQPVVPGADTGRVLTAAAVFEAQQKIGPRAVVVGGGELGCELAEWAAERRCSVTIIEQSSEVLSKAKSLPKAELIGRLQRKGVQILTDTTVESIGSRSVSIVGADGVGQEIPADTVVLAVGNRPDNTLYEQIRNQGREAYLIGDALQPGNVGSALRSAVDVATRI